MSSAPCKGNTLIIRLLPLQGAGGVWVPFTQGAALGYVLLPLRGVLFMSFDTPSIAVTSCFSVANGYGRNAVASYDLYSRILNYSINLIHTNI